MHGPMQLLHSSPPSAPVAVAAWRRRRRWCCGWSADYIKFICHSGVQFIINFIHNGLCRLFMEITLCCCCCCGTHKLGTQASQCIIQVGKCSQLFANRMWIACIILLLSIDRMKWKNGQKREAACQKDLSPALFWCYGWADHRSSRSNWVLYLPSTAAPSNSNLRKGRGWCWDTKCGSCGVNALFKGQRITIIIKESPLLSTRELWCNKPRVEWIAEQQWQENDCGTGPHCTPKEQRQRGANHADFMCQLLRVCSYQYLAECQTLPSHSTTKLSSMNDCPGSFPYNYRDGGPR